MNPRGCGGDNPCEWYKPRPNPSRGPGWCVHPDLYDWMAEHKATELPIQMKGIRMARTADACRRRDDFCGVGGTRWEPRPAYEPRKVSA